MSSPGHGEVETEPRLKHILWLQVHLTFALWPNRWREESIMSRKKKMERKDVHLRGQCGNIVASGLKRKTFSTTLRLPVL